MKLLLCKTKQLPFASSQSKLCTVSFLVQKKDHCSQSFSAEHKNRGTICSSLWLWADVGVKAATIWTTSTPKLILNVFIMCCWFKPSLSAGAQAKVYLVLIQMRHQFGNHGYLTASGIEGSGSQTAAVYIWKGGDDALFCEKPNDKQRAPNITNKPLWQKDFTVVLALTFSKRTA